MIEISKISGELYCIIIANFDDYDKPVTIEIVSSIKVVLTLDTILIN